MPPPQSVSSAPILGRWIKYRSQQMPEFRAGCQPGLFLPCPIGLQAELGRCCDGGSGQPRVFVGWVSDCPEQWGPKKRIWEPCAPWWGAGPGLGWGMGGCDIMGYRGLTLCFHTCGVCTGLGARERLALPPSSLW